MGRHAQIKAEIAGLLDAVVEELILEVAVGVVRIETGLLADVVEEPIKEVAAGAARLEIGLLDAVVEELIKGLARRFQRRPALRLPRLPDPTPTRSPIPVPTS